MGNVKLPQEVIDALAKGEADALREGLENPELRTNPAFLAKVRQFLKDNNFITTTELAGVEQIIQDVSNIPDLISEEYAN